MKPKIVILYIASASDNLDVVERFWIAKLRKLGLDLCNHTEGGEGSLGHVPWNKGKKMPDEFRKKCSVAKTGCKNVNKRHKFLVIQSDGIELCFRGIQSVADHYDVAYTTVERILNNRTGNRYSFSKHRCVIRRIS